MKDGDDDFWVGACLMYLSTVIFRSVIPAWGCFPLMTEVTAI